MIPTLDLSELRDDGDVLKLDDGRVLRLRVEVDQNASINDYDSDGRVEWTRNNPDTGHSQRPSTFNGTARIIDRDRNSCLWWQPYEDLTTEQIREEEPRILELVTYGFKGIVLELLDGRDAYNRPIVADIASLWGVDSLEDGYLAEILNDLVSELRGLKSTRLEES